MGSRIVEVAIGLAFVYLLLSLICTIVTEWIAAILALRASTLQTGIRNLLTDGGGSTRATREALKGFLKQSLGNDPVKAREALDSIAKNTLFPVAERVKAITRYLQDPLVTGEARAAAQALQAKLVSLQNLPDRFYNHPFIKEIGATTITDRLIRLLGFGRDSRPSYISADRFAAALVDSVANLSEEPGRPSAAPLPQPFAGITNLVRNLPDSGLKTALTTLAAEAQHDVAKTRANIEEWFNTTMDRVSGWYKRRSQAVILGVAVFVAVAANADSWQIGDVLWHNDAARAAVNDAAAKVIADDETAAAECASPAAGTAAAPAAGPTPSPLPPSKRLACIQDRVNALPLPLGWQTGLPEAPTSEEGIRSWGAKLLGLVVTAAALSLGAPFWFDLLSKIVNLRLAGKVPDRK